MVLAIPASPARADSPEVKVVDFGFQPAQVQVARDDVVRWTNTSGSTHHVVADDGSFESDDLSSQDNYANVFSTLGTFPYHCSIHPTMKGVVEVVDTISSSPAPTLDSSTSTKVTKSSGSNVWIFVVAAVVVVVAAVVVIMMRRKH